MIAFIGGDEHEVAVVPPRLTFVSSLRPFRATIQASWYGRWLPGLSALLTPLSNIVLKRQGQKDCRDEEVDRGHDEQDNDEGIHTQLFALGNGTVTEAQGLPSLLPYTVETRWTNEIIRIYVLIYTGGIWMSDERGGRGGWWVVAQMPLLALTITAPVAEQLLAREERWSNALAWPSRLVGLIGLAAACRAFVATKRALGQYLVAYPKPAQGAVFRDVGPFRIVRHPMYLAIIVGTFAWALLWVSRLGLALSALCAAFFYFKSRSEERFLVARFAEYPAYRRSVPRLIPRRRPRNPRVP